MKFKGTKTECGIVEPNWQETSIYSKGKTIYKFNEEEENAYNKHSKEMLEMLQWFAENFEDVFHEGTEADNKVREAKQLIKKATEL